MPATPFRAALTALAATLLFFAGCGSSGGSSSDSTSDSTTSTADRNYTATASVGDFILIGIDEDAQTITYENVSNSETGTVSYTVESDGSYSITDPDGHVVAAYEIPGFALILDMRNAGSTADQPALVTAIIREDVTTDTLKNQQYNYFSTTDVGGINIGHAGFDGDGNLTTSGYTPVSAHITDPLGPGQFETDTMPASSFTTGPGNDYIVVEETDPSPDSDATVYTYMFYTASGVFAVDTPFSSILAIDKADSPDFQADYAGTYEAIIYAKNDCTVSVTDGDLVENGTVEMLQGTITVGTDGSIDVVDGDGATVVNTTLTPFKDNTDWYDGTSGKVSDQCNGLFYFTSSGQDIFVAFIDQAMFLCSFNIDSPEPSLQYDYFFGVGLDSGGTTAVTKIEHPHELVRNLASVLRAP